MTEAAPDDIPYDGYRGPAGFACMHKDFPTKRFLRQYPEDIKRPALAVLYGYFGKDWTTIAEFCHMFSDRPHLLEIHLCYGRPDPLLPDYARQVNNILRGVIYPSTLVVVSPILEDRCNNTEWLLAAKRVKRYLNWPLARSGLQSQAGARYQELHGQFPQFTKSPLLTIANPDGTSIRFNDGETYLTKDKKGWMSFTEAKSYTEAHKKRYAMFLWSATQQGMPHAQDWNDKRPPLHRFDGMLPKDIVTDQAIDGMRELLR